MTLQHILSKEVSLSKLWILTNFLVLQNDILKRQEIYLGSFFQFIIGAADIIFSMHILYNYFI